MTPPRDIRIRLLLSERHRRRISGLTRLELMHQDLVIIQTIHRPLIMSRVWRTWARSISQRGTITRDLANTLVISIWSRLRQLTVKLAKLRDVISGPNRLIMTNQGQETTLRFHQRLALPRAPQLWAESTKKSAISTLDQVSMIMMHPSSSLNLVPRCVSVQRSVKISGKSLRMSFPDQVTM